MWDPASIKALALDLDGTMLRPDFRLSEFTRLVAGRCLNRGIKIILCTGRSVRSAERYRRALGAQGPMAYCNGAEVVEMPSGDFLDLKLLDRQSALSCLEISRRNRVYFQIFLPGAQGEPLETLLSEEITEETGLYQAKTGLSPMVEDLQGIMQHPNFRGCLKAMYLGKPAALRLVRQELESALGDRISLTSSAPVSLEAMAPGVTKGEGLKKIMAYYGFGPPEVIALGDEENDLSMFEICHSAAPANAREEIRAAAEFIVQSHAVDGPARFLNDFFKLKAL